MPARKRSAELLSRLHPRLRDWFAATFGELTEAQRLALPLILKGESVLLTSPTGSGKTLAGFLGVFDYLLREREAGRLMERVYCIYVSPLRALTYDISKNLRGPIVGMGLEFRWSDWSGSLVGMARCGVGGHRSATSHPSAAWGCRQRRRRSMYSHSSS